jgi:hypothetical protein
MRDDGTIIGEAKLDVACYGEGEYNQMKVPLE